MNGSHLKFSKESITCTTGEAFRILLFIGRIHNDYIVTSCFISICNPTNTIFDNQTILNLNSNIMSCLFKHCDLIFIRSIIIDNLDAQSIYLDETILQRNQYLALIDADAIVNGIFDSFK